MDIHLKPHLQLPGCSLRAETPLRTAAPPMGQITLSVTSPGTLTPLCYLSTTLHVFGWMNSPLLFSCPSLMASQKQTGALSWHINLCQPKHTQAVCACWMQGRDCSKPALHLLPSMNKSEQHQAEDGVCTEALLGGF